MEGALTASVQSFFLHFIDIIVKLSAVVLEQIIYAGITEVFALVNPTNCK